MNSRTKWFITAVLVLFGVILFFKGLELQSLGDDVDGAGIGIYLGIFEVNDRVMERDIPVYAMSFLFLGGLFSLTGLLLIAGMLLKVSRGRHVQS